MSKFVITQGKGFRMTFANGWAISVQWGQFNYCDNYGRKPLAESTEEMCKYERECGAQGSTTAEVAIINPSGRMVRLSTYDTVEGHVSADKVLELMNSIASGNFVEPEGDDLF